MGPSIVRMVIKELTDETIKYLYSFAYHMLLNKKCTLFQKGKKKKKKIFPESYLP